MTSAHGPEEAERAELLNAQADELLTPAQESQLVELLRTDGAFRRDYIRMCQLTTHLMWAASVPQAVEGRPQQKDADVSSVVPVRSTSRRAGFPVQLLAITGSLLLIVVGAWWQFSGSRDNAHPDLLTSVAGEVVIIRRVQPPITIRAADIQRSPWPLQSGDRIQTERTGSAVVTLADRTQLLLGVESAVTLGADTHWRVNLWHGQLSARVAPQTPQDPLVFRTPQASVQVLGTELELLVEDQRIEVAVTEGKVRVARHSDGATSDVAAGQFLSVDDRSPLSVIDWPRPADDWQAHFEEGLPTGWIGTFVDAGLPAGSRGGAQATIPSDATHVQKLLSTPLVDAGLFAWHPDSLLEVTFRVQPPAWFQICLETRTYQQAEPLTVWCRVDPELWQTQPGVWRTVRLPLSEFHWTGSTPPGPTLGRIPLRLKFMGPADLPGIVIDSLRVKRRDLP